jgi:hypothetical protein
MKFFYLIFILLLAGTVNAQKADADLATLLNTPRQYSVLKTSEAVTIDGKAMEPIWAKVPWSDAFIEIQGKPGSNDPFGTRFKMIWDNENLYVYTEFKEEHIWAKLKEHDQSIFQNNCLEIFIDHDGDTHNYIEFQINAFEAVWDLFMTKPYRNGGTSLSTWDIKELKKAVYVDGTLNDPSDKDKYWSIELAFPLSSLVARNIPKAGTVWRMNFSRVQYEMEVKDGIYERKPGANGRPGQPTYYVWSAQGLVNLHMPERYGYVKFVDNLNPNENFANSETEQAKRVLWKYYYLQQDYKAKNGKYATTIADLQKDFPNVAFVEASGIRLIGTELQYQLQVINPALKATLTIDHEGRQMQTAIN